jgi:cytochrome c oxidase subunit II
MAPRGRISKLRRVTSTGLLVAIAYGVASLIGVAVSILVWRSTRRRGEVDTEQLAERERTWLVVVAVTLLALLAATIFFTPYHHGAAAAEGHDGQQIRVEALQFGWKIDPPQARVGQTVHFHLTTPDVNHGFGVYDPDGRLVYQVQVMPGHAQHGRHTFDKPGRYEILCLEFCGVHHHRMIGALEILP